MVKGPFAGLREDLVAGAASSSKGGEVTAGFPAPLIAVEASGAYRNRFFARCEAGAEPRSLAPFVHNWHAVTENFCLGTLQYLGTIARYRQGTADEATRSRLESALAVAVEISAGEFGFGHHGSAGFHYNMFARLRDPRVPTWRMDGSGDHPTTAETDELVDWFDRAFSDVLLGAGVLRVVERTAFRIVQAMDRLFPSGTNGSEGWSEHQREYITLHLELEPVHAGTVETVVHELAWSLDARDSIDRATATTCSLFADFWNRMNRDVFGPDAPGPGDGE